jgi:hypothetical protein
MVDARRSDPDATYFVFLKRRKVKEICKIRCSVGIIYLQNVNYAVFIAVIFVENVKKKIIFVGSYLCKITCLEDAVRE